MHIGVFGNQGSWYVNELCRRGAERGHVMWPLQFRFRVDAPVRVRPVATIDFERVAPAKPRRVTLNLSSDVPGRAIAFQNPKCEDPRVQLALEANDGR